MASMEAARSVEAPSVIAPAPAVVAPAPAVVAPTPVVAAPAPAASRLPAAMAPAAAALTPAATRVRSASGEAAAKAKAAMAPAAAAMAPAAAAAGQKAKAAAAEAKAKLGPAAAAAGAKAAEGGKKILSKLSFERRKKALHTTEKGLALIDAVHPDVKSPALTGRFEAQLAEIGRGTLSLSWRLVMAPPSVLAYVVNHELAHLRHPNHSPAFWAEVERLMPGHAIHRHWLRRQGDELRRRLPSA